LKLFFKCFVHTGICLAFFIEHVIFVVNKTCTLCGERLNNIDATLS